MKQNERNTEYNASGQYGEGPTGYTVPYINDKEELGYIIFPVNKHWERIFRALPYVDRNLIRYFFGDNLTGYHEEILPRGKRVKGKYVVPAKMRNTALYDIKRQYRTGERSAGGKRVQLLYAIKRFEYERGNLDYYPPKYFYDHYRGFVNPYTTTEPDDIKLTGTYVEAKFWGKHNNGSSSTAIRKKGVPKSKRGLSYYLSRNTAGKN